jgi:hypothetical protein
VDTLRSVLHIVNFIRSDYVASNLNTETSCSKMSHQCIHTVALNCQYFDLEK